MLRGGDFRQVGGEFIFEEGRVTFCHRMKNTRDHAEIPVVRRELGLDGERPPARKRWSTNGLGAGMGRRLSQRRQSWGTSRSRSRNTEKGSEVHMSGVKEETDVMPEDALKKLEGNKDAKVVDDVANGDVKEQTNGSAEGLVNGTANGYVTA
ncbi:hypothetical protein ABVK25_011996 [Lepraria finkii]|uniref:Uncharacterized protein n=1 Tax=Lepraria finkii TaxID=1340010 RepID=A0ABR4ALX4_9LECA